jgi:hypothetical protein
VLLSVPAILVSGLYSTRVGRPLSPTRLHKRYAISSPFSSFVVGPGGDHDLLVAERFYWVQFGGLHGGEPAADYAYYDKDHAG